MSWFDAAGLANIAKSALKEAQRTIDKALDIKEEPNAVPVNTPVDPALEDFFGTWGITQSGKVNVNNVTKESIEDKLNQESLTTSLWGSFTGSFFDNVKEPEKLSASNSLEDTVDATTEHFNQSKLVVQQSEESDQLSPLRDDKVEEKFDKTSKSIINSDYQFVDINLGIFFFCS